MDEDGPQRLRVLVSDERGQRLSARRLGPWLERVAPARAAGAVSIAIVSDARSRALNRTYRHKDYATDVLSFPAGPKPGALDPKREARSPKPMFLGDIVIARGVAERQAREAGHDEATEWRVLALHGLLHLLGYDHERDNGRMRRVETGLRKKGGLREGLTARASGHGVAARRRRTRR
jgi:probable rRNA maturation factor